MSSSEQRSVEIPRMGQKSLTQKIIQKIFMKALKKTTLLSKHFLNVTPPRIPDSWVSSFELPAWSRIP